MQRSGVKDMEAREWAASPETILNVQGLTVEYGRRGKGRNPSPPLLAVDHVSFQLRRGESLALIGESGSGKSTLGYAVINLLPKTAHMSADSMHLDGVGELTRLAPLQWGSVRGARIGMVFQGAQNMFNPLMTIGKQFGDIFAAHQVPLAEGMAEAERLMRATRLDPSRIIGSYPHELSGGMRQRVAIVAAVMLHPEILVLDEPTTALDVVSQAQVLGILRDIRARYGLTLIFITHDFAVASNIGDRVAVMYAGELVEIGRAEDVYESPRHPYTRGLIGAVPSLSDQDRGLVAIPGQPPDMRNVPAGCRFADRCRFAEPGCRTTHPVPVATDIPDHVVSCLRWQDIINATGEEVHANG
jgi:peptide/nickel transport system ATP-binding protein